MICDITFTCDWVYSGKHEGNYQCLLEFYDNGVQGFGNLKMGVDVYENGFLWIWEDAIEVIGL